MTRLISYWKPAVVSAALLLFTFGAKAEPNSDLAAGASSPAAQAADAPATEDTLNGQLKEESDRLAQMAEKLRLIESAPLDSAPKPAAPPAKPQARAEDIPAAPLPGAREAYADALYAIGKYDRAREVYRQIAEGKPGPETLAWVRMQIGHCSRRLDDLPGAAAAYEAVLNEAPQAPWAKEAAWWAGQVKWWMLWHETMKRDSPPSASPKPQTVAARTPAP